MALALSMGEIIACWENVYDYVSDSDDDAIKLSLVSVVVKSLMCNINNTSLLERAGSINHHPLFNIWTITYNSIITFIGMNRETQLALEGTQIVPDDVWVLGDIDGL